MGAGRRKRPNRRLTRLNSVMEDREVLELLRRQPSRRGEQPSLLIHPIVWLGTLIARSGVQITLRGTLTTMLVIAVIAFLALQGALAVGRLPTILAPLPIQAALALPMALLLPPRYLPSRVAARKRKVGDQLPDALDIMVRSLNAGHPIKPARSEA